MIASRIQTLTAILGLTVFASVKYNAVNCRLFGSDNAIESVVSMNDLKFAVGEESRLLREMGVALIDYSEAVDTSKEYVSKEIVIVKRDELTKQHKILKDIYLVIKQRDNNLPLEFDKYLVSKSQEVDKILLEISTIK